MKPVAVPNQTPRIDRIVERLERRDDGMFDNTGEVSVLRGAPTRGATLDNLWGCPAEPRDHRTTAFVLLPGVPPSRP